MMEIFTCDHCGAEFSIGEQPFSTNKCCARPAFQS